jgi:hypothetical protein
MEQAIRQQSAECNCGGTGVRSFFEYQWESPEQKSKRETEMRAVPKRCPLHGRILIVVFPDVTIRPPGYERKRALRGN